MRSFINDFINNWRGVSSGDFAHESLFYELSTALEIKQISDDLNKILADQSKDLNTKKQEFVSYCSNKLSGNDMPLGTDFNDAVGEMFDQTIKDIKWSNTKRTLAMPITAATRLVFGVVGLGVRIAGNTLKFAGKVLDTVTLGVINKIPGLSHQVGRDLAYENVDVTSDKKYGKFSSDGTFKMSEEGMHELEKIRLNQLQIAGTHMVNLGKGMINNQVSPDQTEKHLKDFAVKVRAEGNKKKRSR